MNNPKPYSITAQVIDVIVVLIVVGILLFALGLCGVFGVIVSPRAATTAATAGKPMVVSIAVAQPPIVNSNYTGGGYVVNLEWNSSQTTNVTYNVYFGSASRTYTNITPVGSWTNVPVRCEFGHMIFYVVTAENSIGIESAPSTEVSYGLWEPDRITITGSTSGAPTLLWTTNAALPMSKWMVAVKPFTGSFTWTNISDTRRFYRLLGNTNALAWMAWNTLNPTNT